jgi:hypothetical protein
MLANGFAPIIDEQLDFSNAMQTVLEAAGIPTQNAHTICGPCFVDACEKATDSPGCYCCVANHVI